MDNVASASINTFGPSPKADFVPPSEQLITLTYGQLQDLVIQAVEKAIQPLQDEISQLKATLACQDAKIAAFEATEEHDVNRLARDIAYDRQRLAKLESKPVKEPGKTEISRAKKIERYLLSRPDHRATFETLKGHLGVDKDLLNDAIKTLMNSSPGRYGITRTPGDKRKRTIIMLPK
jgi:hypothetical protein